MANLRILNAACSDSRMIKIKFSNDLRESLTISNVYVKSEQKGVPDCKVKSLQIDGNILTLDTFPQTPYSKYKIILRSTDDVKFSDITGKILLIEDGVSNTINVLGAENAEDSVRDRMVEFLGASDTIYNLSRGTLIRDFLNSKSKYITKTHQDIGQLKSDNYLSLTIKDERKTRSYGPWDRLNREGAFDVIRVGLTPTDQTIDGTYFFNQFPREPISLQSIKTKETLQSGFENIDGTFNKITITTLKKQVTKLLSLKIQIRFYFS